MDVLRRTGRVTSRKSRPEERGQFRRGQPGAVPPVARDLKSRRGCRSRPCAGPPIEFAIQLGTRRALYWWRG